MKSKNVLSGSLAGLQDTSCVVSGAAVLAVAAAALIGVGSPASSAVSGPWVMQPYTSAYCIHPRSYSSAAGTVVEQTLCQSGTDRDWNFHSISAGYYRISYRNGGLCFGVSGSSTANSAKIVMARCGNPTLSDQWLPIPRTSADGVDYYFLKNRNSGKCLNVQGGSTANGADLIQFTCDYDAENEWFTWNAPN